MERPPARRGCGAFYGSDWRLSAVFALVFVIYASFGTMLAFANNATESNLQTPSPGGAITTTSDGALRISTESSSTNSLQETSTVPPAISLPSSSSPITLDSIANMTENVSSTKIAVTPVGSPAPSVSSSLTPVQTTKRGPVPGASKAPPSLQSNISSIISSPKTATPAGYVLVSETTGSFGITTKGISESPKGEQTDVPGSRDQQSTAPPTATSIVQETAVRTILVAKTLPMNDVITNTGASVTLGTNANLFGGDGLDPEHEKDELKKLLLIVGCSIAAALLIILVVFAIVYRVAQRRRKKANSRYYNFKKKKSNYERVLYLQDYQHGEMGAESSPGTGTAWVFQESDRQNANKAITLEFDRKDAGTETPVGKRGRKKSRNKNKNNGNKTDRYRGNYQVLADMFPANRSLPPDVLLSADGVLHSNGGEEDDGILDTSFGPVVRTTPAGPAVSAVAVDTPVKETNDEGATSPWPSWNTSRYVTITNEDAVVEL